MPDLDPCPGHPCAVTGPHLAHGTKYLNADQVTRVWRPGPRLPSAQYTVTLAMTGDDIGMDALGAVIPPILTSNLGMSSVHVTDIRSGYPAETPPVPAAPERPTYNEMVAAADRVAAARQGIKRSTAYAVVQALAAMNWYPGGKAAGAQSEPAPVVRIHTGHARTVTVYVDGAGVASGSYDDYGWSGLGMIGQLATSIADAAGLTVVTCEGESTGHCDDGDHDV